MKLIFCNNMRYEKQLLDLEILSIIALAGLWRDLTPEPKWLI